MNTKLFLAAVAASMLLPFTAVADSAADKEIDEVVSFASKADKQSVELETRTIDVAIEVNKQALIAPAKLAAPVAPPAAVAPITVAANTSADD